MFLDYLYFELVTWHVNPCCDNKKSVILATKITLHEYKQTKIDDLNAVVKIEIEGKDYKSKVDSVLNNYRKKRIYQDFEKGMYHWVS